MNEIWSIIILPDVLKKIKKLQPREQARIKRAIGKLENFPTQGDIKPMEGQNGWRLREGDWRIIFRIDSQSHSLVITHFGSRGDVYKR